MAVQKSKNQSSLKKNFLKKFFFNKKNSKYNCSQEHYKKEKIFFFRLDGLPRFYDTLVPSKIYNKSLCLDFNKPLKLKTKTHNICMFNKKIKIYV